MELTEIPPPLLTSTPSSQEETQVNKPKRAILLKKISLKHKHKKI